MNRDPLHARIASLQDELAKAHALISEMRMDRTRDVHELYGVADLTKREAEIVSAIAKHRRITHDRLFSILYADSDTTVGMNTVQVQMVAIRRKLAPHGIAIKTLWKVGYEMAADDVAKLRDLAA